MRNSMELKMKDILYCFIPLYLSGILCNAFCSYYYYYCNLLRTLYFTIDSTENTVTYRYYPRKTRLE